MPMRWAAAGSSDGCRRPVGDDEQRSAPAISPGARSSPASMSPASMRWADVSSFVSDVRLPGFVARVVPLVEVDFQTAVDRGAAGQTTGTINVGGVWIGRAVQLGVEMVIPANDRTSPALGVRAFIRIDLDALSPRLGRPV